MPKLSRYINSERTPAVNDGARLVFNEKVRPEEYLAGPSAATLKRSSAPVAGDAGAVGDSQTSEGSAGRRDRLQTAWERRSQTYGPRRYRHEDGSVSATRPPRNPYAVASRSSWNDLVRYCRQETSTSPAMAATQQMRYGGGAAHYSEHVAYLKSLGDMSPELGEDGGFLGFDEVRRQPLEDGEHAFNSYFADKAKEVFRSAGRRQRDS